MKMVWLLLMLAEIAGAKVLSASYEVTFGIFEALGTADARLEIKDDQTYSIRIEAKTTGIAKFLTNNRVEVYESYGMVEEGILVPKKYVKIRQTNSKKRIKIYTFDHLNKIVWKENIDNAEWDKIQNDFYASDDILSLFFNFKQRIRPGQNQSFQAIGGNNKDGRIDVVSPKDKALHIMMSKLEKEEGDFLRVVLNDRIFSSAKGELLINLGSDGLCEKAVLEDVLLFGDIVGKRIR